jgi:perosamine synthetase
MTMRFRHVAPAGAPIRAGDLGRWAACALSQADAASQLREQLAFRLGVKHAFLTSTGRAGLTVLLRAMRRLADPMRQDVLLPAYTCYSVAASVIKAGLRPRLVDVSPETLDFAAGALDAADFSRVLAVVATNLYGYPNDLPAICAAAAAHGAFVIDDAAQSLGATIAGRPSGTWGDSGLYSFDKGKNVAAIAGGVVVTNRDDLRAALAAELKTLAPAAVGASLSGVAKALAYSALLRPWLYWIPNRIPQLGLGRTVFTTEFPLETPAPALTALAATMVRRLDDLTAVRRENAAALLDGLRTVSGISTISPAPDSSPVYLRLALLVSEAPRRGEAIRRLNIAGIGGTESYPSSLADVPELRSFLADAPGEMVGARQVASRLITLPTHPFTTPADVARATEVLRTCLSGTGETGAFFGPCRSLGGASQTVRRP